MTTSKHSETLLLENYVRMVALTFDLQSFIIKLLLLLILMKGSYPSFTQGAPRGGRDFQSKQLTVLG